VRSDHEWARLKKKAPLITGPSLLVAVCTWQIVPDLDENEAKTVIGPKQSRFDSSVARLHHRQCNRADTRTERMLFCCTPRRRAMRFFNISDDLLFGAALAFVIAVVLALA